MNGIEKRKAKTNTYLNVLGPRQWGKVLAVLLFRCGVAQL